MKKYMDYVAEATEVVAEIRPWDLDVGPWTLGPCLWVVQRYSLGAGKPEFRQVPPNVS